MGGPSGRALPQAILLNPYGSGPAMVRSLHHHGVEVSVLVPPATAWLSRTRWADGYVLPQIEDNSQAWLDRLSRIAERGPGVLISGDDVATEFLVKERSRIPAHLRSFESQHSAHLELLDKTPQYELAARVGVRFPWTVRLSAMEELDAVAKQASYPCLVKPALSHQFRHLFSNRRVFVIDGADDLRGVAGPALEAGLELLVTEYVPGPETAIEAAMIVRTADGSLPLAYGMRKIRQWPPGFGAGTLNESVAIPDTMALGKRLLDAAAYEGIAGVEIKRHAETGELVLMEISVRVDTHFALGDACGVDATWRLYATLAGIPLGPQPPQRLGVRSIVPSLEPRLVGKQLWQRELSPRDLLASYRGLRDLSGLTLRDPGPVLALVALQWRRGTTFLRRRRSSSGTSAT
jgi:D-aspartate ligase